MPHPPHLQARQLMVAGIMPQVNDAPGQSRGGRQTGHRGGSSPSLLGVCHTIDQPTQRGRGGRTGLTEAAAGR